MLDSHLGTITNPHPKSQNFFDFADEIMETKGHARKVSLKTAVDHFRDCLGEDATLEGIGYTDIEGFRDYLKALPGISANSGNMYLICIRAIFNEAKRGESQQTRRSGSGSKPQRSSPHSWNWQN